MEVQGSQGNLTISRTQGTEAPANVQGNGNCAFQDEKSSEIVDLTEKQRQPDSLSSPISKSANREDLLGATEAIDASNSTSEQDNRCQGETGPPVSKKPSGAFQKLKSAVFRGYPKSVDKTNEISVLDQALMITSPKQGSQGSPKSPLEAVSPRRASPVFKKSLSPTGKNMIRNMFSTGTRKNAAGNPSGCHANSDNDAEDDEDADNDSRCMLRPPNYKDIIHDRSPGLMSVPNPNVQWALYMVVTANNGIRREVCDMYKMFRDMEKRPLMLTVDDIEVLQRWLRSFEAILQIMFKLEENHLYHWIEGQDLMSEEARKWEEPRNKLSGELFAGKRIMRKGMILQTLNDMAEFDVGSFTGRPVIEKMGELGCLVNKFADGLFEYLCLKERILVKEIASNNLTPKDCKRYERNFWSFLQAACNNCNDSAGAVIVSMTRWMVVSERRRWLRQYLPQNARSQYTRWLNMYTERHLAPIKELEKRVDLAFQERKEELNETRAASMHARLAAKAREYIWLQTVVNSEATEDEPLDEDYANQNNAAEHPDTEAGPSHLSAA